MKKESHYSLLDYNAIDDITRRFLSADFPKANDFNNPGAVSTQSKLYYYDSLDSTNIKAKELLAKGAKPPFIIVAEEQTGGKGRMKRAWYSPSRQGIWISFAFPPYSDVKLAGYFNYVISLAVAESIADITGLDTTFKWPNDIQVNGKKICGILSENRVSASGELTMITGAGINVNIGQGEFAPEIRQIATSLMIESGRPVDRNALYGALTAKVAELYTEWHTTGINTIFEKWKQRCNTIGQEVTISTEKSRISGIAEGINLDGSLQLKDDAGQIKNIYAGDVEYTIK